MLSSPKFGRMEFSLLHSKAKPLTYILSSLLILATCHGDAQAMHHHSSENTEKSNESIENRLSNFSKVTPEIWRGANPHDRDLSSLKSMGVKSIVNLRMSGKAVEHEKKIAQKLGIRYFHIPFGYRKPCSKKIEKVLSIITNPENQPVFIHCRQGADRTGMVVGIYRSLFQNWRFEDTYREMRSHHFKPWFGGLKTTVRNCSKNEPLLTARDHILKEKLKKSRRTLAQSSSADLTM